jgi:hypothetical protein
MLGVRRIVLELAAQLGQIHTQIMPFVRVRRSPDLLEQLLAADDLAPIAHLAAIHGVKYR